MQVFVTVGTTRFDKLIQTVLSPEVLTKLKGKGYTSLTLQTGNSNFNKEGKMQIIVKCTCGSRVGVTKKFFGH
jgi:beta-1,4-N-acetylglucosaminyltransferase